MSLGFDSSKELFSIGGEAEGGSTNANGSVDGLLSGGVSSFGDFCHGINIGLGAEIKAQAQGSVEIARFLGLEGDASANAQLDASLRAQLPIEVFDAAGIIVQAQAAANASASAEIKISILFQQVVDQARGKIDALAFDLLLLLLEEARVGGRAFAQATAGASASATATLAFRLEED